MGRVLIDLSHRRARSPSLAGGKGSGLARLVSHGYQVPPAFIIPTTAFRRLQSGFLREMNSSEEDLTPERLSEIRKCIVSTPLPPSIRDAALEAFARLGHQVAVRSSMTGEDSRTSSFAGLLDTYLSIEDQQSLLAAVQQCFASSFNWRLWKYQQTQGTNRQNIRKILPMAVIIQDMVNAEASGVAFSSDPNTGSSNVIIEAVFGTGESLVQGNSVPFRYIIDDSRNLKQVLNQPEGDSPLSQQEVLTLAGFIRKIAATCDCPQDIEWAWDGKDFYFLQCRPITALPEQRIYSARVVADMSPGLVKPLLWSTKSRSMVRSVFGRICRELLGPHQIDFATYIKRIHSRTYADMTAFGDFLARLGLPPNFFEMITRHEKSNWHRSMLQPRKIPILFRMMRFAFRHFRTDKEITSFIQTQSIRLEPFRNMDWETLPPDKLIEKFDQLMDLHAQTQWYIFIGPLNMTLRYRMLSRILKGVSEEINPGSLLKGVEGLQALAPNSYIRQMSEMAQDLDEYTLSLMLKGETQELEERLSMSKPGKLLLQEFQNFLSRFGFLSANGSDFSAIPWCEDSNQVWRSIGRLALGKTSWDVDDIQENRDREVLRIRKRLKGIRRVYYDRLLRSTVQYMKHRESTSLIMSEETYLMRCALLNIGFQLKNEGRLSDPSDIFYFYHDELCSFIDKTLSDEEVKKRTVDRKSEMAQDALIDPPPIVSSCGTSPTLEIQDEHCEYLEGIPGSPGRARGRALIVTDPNSLSTELDPDHILVVPFTDVGWTPLLPGIKGIIAETGGQLSHTSIIAREYGMPSVVSVRDATSKVRDGQPITIDGNRGRIYLKYI